MRFDCSVALLFHFWSCLPAAVPELVRAFVISTGEEELHSSSAAKMAGDCKSIGRKVKMELLDSFTKRRLRCRKRVVSLHLTLGVPGPLDAGFSINGWLAVLLTFLLARVFAEGTLMREDLEGTV